MTRPQPQPRNKLVGHSLVTSIMVLSANDWRTCHDAQRAILHAFMEVPEEPDPAGAHEILETCGLAVKYQADDDMKPESDTAPAPDWGTFDGPFLRGGKERHYRA